MDINKISKKQLLSIKGIDEALADQILQHRPFKQLEDLLEIKGFSKGILARLKKKKIEVAEIKDEKDIRLKILGEISTEAEGIILGFLFDLEEKLIGKIQFNKQQSVTVGQDLIGTPIRVFAGPDVDVPQDPRVSWFQRKGFAERIITIPELKPNLNIGNWIIPHLHFHWSCCRVKGRVLKRIVLPNGHTRSLALCNARIEICEVDKSPRILIAQLPVELLNRFRMELIELGKPHDYDVEQAPLENLVTINMDRFQQLRALPASTELTNLAAKLQTTRGIEISRQLILDRIQILRPYWCHFEWLFFNFRVDCIKTVDLDVNGYFDTNIWYPCYGDKPDLYFKVQQNCHPGGWKTVYSPSVPCSTIWNYCCGDAVNITVTHPDAAVGLTPGGCEFPYVAGDPASIGEWQSIGDSEVFSVHAAVLRTGKVLLFSGGVENQLPLESRVWDPATGNFTSQSFQDDLFCAHQLVLADGRVLVMGGSNYNGPHGRGIDASYTFNPITESWTKHPDLNFGRWYPTSVLLSNGKALTFSGRAPDTGIIQQVERFDPGTNTWTILPDSANKTLEIYPSMHLMKDGTIFYTGCRWAGQNRNWASPDDTALFNNSTNSWSDVGAHVITNRTEATSVLLPPARAMSMEGHEHGEELPPPPSDQRVLVLGGEADDPANRNSAEIIDMSDPSPSWVRIADMHHRRVNPNAVILPDRRVLVVGGVTGYKFDWNPGNVLECEIFDPTSETWTRAASMARPRQYHSISVLLPDGRVLATGTSASSGNDFSMELYSPAYLFRGPRPRITGYPVSANYNSMITISSPDACRIKDVVLIRPGAPTHHTDSEQRLVPLHIHAINACDIRLKLPSNQNLLPPGYYMLFIVDDCEIPSVARFVRIG